MRGICLLEMARGGAKRTGRRRGVAMVEFTLVALPLFLILFGIAEMGWLFSRYLCVTQVARQGCRELGLAQPVGGMDGIGQHMTDAATGMKLLQPDGQASMAYELKYRPRTEGGWGDWVTATDAGPQPGDQVKVTVTYTYPALVGGFILGNTNATVSATTVMRREQIYEP